MKFLDLVASTQLEAGPGVDWVIVLVVSCGDSWAMFAGCPFASDAWDSEDDPGWLDLLEAELSALSEVAPTGRIELRRFSDIGDYGPTGRDM